MTDNMTNNIYDFVIYTDGACSGNPGPGGWGVLIEEKDSPPRELSGGVANTTNNRMEMMATIKALQTLPAGAKVQLWTDSEYVKGGITEWIDKWKQNGWRTASKKPVKNVDLWRMLDEEVQKYEIDWQWVRGHTGHAGNERADALARQGLLPYL